MEKTVKGKNRHIGYVIFFMKRCFILLFQLILKANETKLSTNQPKLLGLVMLVRLVLYYRMSKRKGLFIFVKD